MYNVVRSEFLSFLWCITYYGHVRAIPTCRVYQLYDRYTWRMKNLWHSSIVCVRIWMDRSIHIRTQTILCMWCTSTVWLWYDNNVIKVPSIIIYWWSVYNLLTFRLCALVILRVKVEPSFSNFIVNLMEEHTPLRWWSRSYDNNIIIILAGFNSRSNNLWPLRNLLS